MSERHFPSHARPPRTPALASLALACALIALGAIAAAAGMRLDSLAALAGGSGGMAVGVLALSHRHRTRLRDLATTDELTGLANHRGFHELLSLALSTARDERQPLSVVMLDLDDFRRVNDALGRKAANRILATVGSRLRGAIRVSDMAARIGGEEFALILRGADCEAAFAIAERARAAIAAIPLDDVDLTCSAGIAAYPSDSDHASALCELAETALYWAKRAGKARTRRFEAGITPGRRADAQRRELEAMLRAKRPVRPVFQPIVALATGRVVGYEALARFPGASSGSPDIWFAQAHAGGLGPELEAAAIRGALEPAGRPLDAHLALNLSPSTLCSPAVEDALPDDLTGLVIELTEHELVPDDEALASTVALLRRRGARIALDDAGAGHAGLKRLMRVSPDIVKLDRDLIREIDGDPARMALVESFVRFAREVGATVCAEGIETFAELALLAELDVEWGQGYVLGRPGPPWGSVSPRAAEACRESLAAALRGDPGRHGLVNGDRRLVRLSGRLASARSHEDLDQAIGMIADELGASEVAISRWAPETETVVTLAETGAGFHARRFGAGEYPLTARVLHEGSAAQAFLGDPTCDLAEAELLLALGQRSLLMIPVVTRGESIGLLEVYGGQDRPWTRAEIDRARVIANQFASVIQALDAEPALSA